MRDAITLDMKIPNGCEGWTLTEAVEAMKQRGLTGLLVESPEEISEHVLLFTWAVRDGKTPTTGQVLAAYYEAVSEELDKAYYDDDALTNGQYRYRRTKLRRLVFRIPVTV
ncbi:hypothetical protein [Microtetraspora malaysiensis]|uniref:CBS domain-containing protein n=1 Tax=Microtetraspora malaysiensis TaxID=161358 RepID=A0ABW6SMM0_9ACTN